MEGRRPRKAFSLSWSVALLLCWVVDPWLGCLPSTHETLLSILSTASSHMQWLHSCQTQEVNAEGTEVQEPLSENTKGREERSAHQETVLLSADPQDPSCLSLLRRHGAEPSTFQLRLSFHLPQFCFLADLQSAGIAGCYI